MTKQDVKRIFGVSETLKVGDAFVTVADFLSVAGFEDCEPTKEAMLSFDGGVKGYAEFIETGNFES